MLIFGYNTSAYFSFRPKSGEAAKTLFKIGCENWVTKDNPISYRFRYQVNIANLAEINTLSTESQAYQLWYFGKRETPSRFLPIGDPKNDFKLNLSARICNKYESCVDVFLNATVRSFTSCFTLKGPGQPHLRFSLIREVWL